MKNPQAKLGSSLVKVAEVRVRAEGGALGFLQHTAHVPGWPFTPHIFSKLIW